MRSDGYAYRYPELRGQKYQSSENALPFWAKVNQSVGDYKCTLKSTSKIWFNYRRIDVNRSRRSWGHAYLYPTQGVRNTENRRNCITFLSWGRPKRGSDLQYSWKHVKALIQLSSIEFLNCTPEFGEIKKEPIQEVPFIFL